MIDFKDKEGKLGKKGYVYVLIHPIQDGYVKIGQTKMKPKERAKQLTNQCSTGLVGKYIVAYSHEYPNPEYLESIVHERLKDCRVTSCREFFHCNVETAIKIIKETVELLNTQTKINFDLDNPIERWDKIKQTESINLNAPSIWWNSLTPPWKQVFRKYMEEEFNPENEELMEGVFNIITFCRDKDIRESVSKAIEEKNFSTSVGKWYAELKNKVKLKVNSFIPTTPNDNDLEKIRNLEGIDCSGNSLIKNLLPIKKFTKVIFLNCSNTSITTLEPIKEIVDLEEIKIYYTDINSLQPLENLKKLRKIYCHETALSEEEIERFKEINPKCEILTDPFKV